MAPFSDLVLLRLQDRWHVVLSLNWVAAVVLCVVLTLLMWRRRRGWWKWRVSEVSISIPGGSSAKLVPDSEVARIAHQAWAELKTRKAALPFDRDNDVVVEVYNSWYELFRELRALVKTVPVDRLHDQRGAGALADVLVRALNEGLRPHLTTWQAKFRTWFADAAQKPENHGVAPQDVQRGYPEYEELVADLERVNAQLVDFSESLAKLARDRDT